MALERTEAVVLRGVDFSQTSRIVTFLSPDRGLVVCLAKGARRPRSALSGQLDTFNRVEIVFSWRESRSVQPLTECSVLDSYPGIKHDLEKSTYAAFPLELTYKVARENEPSHGLYATLAGGLDCLERWEGDIRLHCGWQAVQLLKAAGFGPALHVCSVCGASVPETPGFAYSGGVTCDGCVSDRRMSTRAYATLVALAEAERDCPLLEADGECFEILLRYAMRQVESDFRSLRVIKQLYGPAGAGSASKSQG